MWQVFLNHCETAPRLCHHSDCRFCLLAQHENFMLRGTVSNFYYVLDNLDITL